MSRLRKQLESVEVGVDTSPDGYRLDVDGELSVDVVEARRVASESGSPDARWDAIRTLRAPFLPGATGDWVAARSAELHLTAVTGLDRLAADLRRSGDGVGALQAAREAIALAPLHETARQELLRAYLAVGSRVDGLRAYEEWRSAIGEELGAVPAPETESLYLSLLGLGDESDGQASSVGAGLPSSDDGRDQTASTLRPGLPDSFRRPLLGRERELVELSDAVRDHRLITVVGLGGAGKSHLVAEFVRSEQAVDATGHKRRVHWISLDGVDAIVDPIEFVADALHVAGSPGTTAAEAAAAMLQESAAVVVLDGSSGQSARRFAEWTSARCPSVTVVVTSRVSLQLEHERLVRIAPLRLESSDGSSPSPAAQLLHDEALRRGADSSVWSMAECERVATRFDGLPLALELAAKRSPLVSPKAMLRALELEDDAAGDLSEILSSVLMWTIGALDEPAKFVFALLVALPDAVELDAIVRLVGDVSPSGRAWSSAELVGALTDLLDLGLVQRLSTNDHIRFAPLRLARSSTTRVAPSLDRSRLRDAHAAYFREATRRAAQAIRTSDEAGAVASIGTNAANSIAALDHLSRAGNHVDALNMATDLIGFAFYRLNASMASAVIRVVSAPGSSSAQGFHEAAAGAALMAWATGDEPAAKAALSWASEGDPTWLYHQAGGVITLYSGDVEASQGHFEQAVALAEQNASAYEQAISLSQRTLIRSLTGTGDALESAIESLRHAEVAQNPTASANASWAMGIALLDLDPEGAAQHLRACRDQALAVDARLSAGAADTPLALLSTRLEASYSERCDAMLKQMAFWLDSSHSAQFWLVAQVAAVLLTERGALRSAALIFGAVAAAPFKVPLPRVERNGVALAKAALEEGLGPRFVQLLREGSTLSAAATAEVVRREFAAVADDQA